MDKNSKDALGSVFLVLMVIAILVLVGTFYD
jgi:hypothetical protein